MSRKRLKLRRRAGLAAPARRLGLHAEQVGRQDFERLGQLLDQRERRADGATLVVGDHFLCGLKQFRQSLLCQPFAFAERGEAPAYALVGFCRLS